MTARYLDIVMRVNGEDVAARVEARKTLVDFLRDDLSLTGTHVGCEHGVCGACTVRLDDAVVRGCLVLAVQCDGAQVETIEGLSDTGALADLQDGVPAAQRAAMRLLHPGHADRRTGTFGRGGVPSRDTIREHLSGNYCRCTGYQAIVDAIESRCRDAGETGKLTMNEHYQTADAVRARRRARRNDDARPERAHRHQVDLLFSGRRQDGNGGGPSASSRQSGQVFSDGRRPAAAEDAGQADADRLLQEPFRLDSPICCRARRLRSRTATPRK